MSSKIVILICSLFLCVSEGFAKENPIELSGKIIDQDGNKLKGVTVNLTKKKYDPITKKEKIEKVIEESRKRPLKFSGVVIDEKGNFLRNVKVKIEKLKTDWIAGKDNRISSVENVDGKFLFKYIGYDAVKFTFAKKGYFQAKKSLSVMNNNIGNIKEDVKIVLREIGELPKKLIEGDIYFSWEKENNGKIVKKGWSYKMDEDGDIEDDIIFNNPKEVEFYIEKSKDGQSVYLISNNKNSGFVGVSDAKDFTYLSIAPEKGYQTKIEIKKNRNGLFKYFYFKLNDKLYGKIKINNPTILDSEYNIFVDYAINPSGSRNVTTVRR